MFAALAQLVEQGTENPCVLGSIPRRGKFFIYYNGQILSTRDLHSPYVPCSRFLRRGKFFVCYDGQILSTRDLHSPYVPCSRFLRRGKFFIYYNGQFCPQGTCTVLTSRAVDSSNAANFLFITTDNFVHKGLAQSLRPVQSIPQTRHFCIKILLRYERWQNEIN